MRKQKKRREKERAFASLCKCLLFLISGETHLCACVCISETKKIFGGKKEGKGKSTETSG